MASAVTPPTRRPDLIVTSIDDGKFVVKDPRAGRYFQIGPVEAFLLDKLDGANTTGQVCAAYQEHFAEPLSAEELADFVHMAAERGFLLRDGLAETSAVTSATVPAPQPRRRLFLQSILFWRIRIFDPDRLLSWLEPQVRCLWTRGFVYASLTLIGLAALILWSSRRDFVDPLATIQRGDTILLIWLAIAAISLLHELAHGLTCKHHGGEVHEIGFLLLFLLPCLYCNVSDSWLIKEKRKRLWITLAGTWCDLCLWALAVFVWRLAQPGTILNQLAWVVLSVCGIRLFLNFNPLLKLDGYYLLSDWLDVPNLRQQSLDYMLAHIRCWLWGAAPPPLQPRGQLLLGFGMACWLFALLYLALLFFAVFALLGKGAVLVSMVLLALVLVCARRLLAGLTVGEVRAMICQRRVRTAVWLVSLAGITLAAFTWSVEEHVAGVFSLRSTNRVELRAPVAGFIDRILSDEGRRVAIGELIARIDVPELSSKLARKRAEVQEARANLRLLELGPRPEQIAEQRRKVERLGHWRDLAGVDLARKQKVLRAELDNLSGKVAQASSEVTYRTTFLRRALGLVERQALAAEQYLEAQKQTAWPGRSWARCRRRRMLGCIVAPWRTRPSWHAASESLPMPSPSCVFSKPARARRRSRFAVPVWPDSKKRHAFSSPNGSRRRCGPR